MHEVFSLNNTVSRIGKKKAVDTAIFRYGVWNFADYLTDRLVPTKYRYQYDEAAELNFGDIINIGDDLNGATLCGDCQRHFKSDGSLEVCNEC